jgi:SET domain-containing protein 6
VISAAQQDIGDDEVLFTIPRNLLLSVENSKLKDQLPANLDELGPWLSLMLVMIYEYLQGEASRWYPYFQALPTSFDTLMFWSASELSELQASAVIDKIGKRGAEESIRDAIMPIIRANPSLFPPNSDIPSYDGPQGEESLLNLTHRMGSLIMAYAFDIGNPDDDARSGQDGYVTDEEEEVYQAMVPLADFLNADAHRNNVSCFLLTATTL